MAQVFSGKRPAVDLAAMPTAYAALLQECWATDPSARPSFPDIIPRMRQLIRDERAADAPADSSAAVGGAGVGRDGGAADGAGAATGNAGGAQGQGQGHARVESGLGSVSEAPAPAVLPSGPGRPAPGPAGGLMAESGPGFGSGFVPGPQAAAVVGSGHPWSKERDARPGLSPFAVDAERRAVAPTPQGGSPQSRG